MHLLFTVLVTFFAGMGAGLGTGFAGMSAAAVISPMLITFLPVSYTHLDVYKRQSPRWWSASVSPCRCCLPWC